MTMKKMKRNKMKNKIVIFIYLYFFGLIFLILIIILKNILNLYYKSFKHMKKYIKFYLVKLYLISFIVCDLIELFVEFRKSSIF